MWPFIFGGKPKRLNTPPSTAFFISRTYRGLSPPPLRISKLSVVELSRKNSGSLTNSSRDWYRVLLFDAAMRGELPYFSDIDNIWTYKLLSQILSVIAAKKHSTVFLQLNLNQSDVLALFIDRIFEPHEQKWARLRVKSWVDSESNVFAWVISRFESIPVDPLEPWADSESIPWKATWVMSRSESIPEDLLESWVHSDSIPWKATWVMS